MDLTPRQRQVLEAMQDGQWRSGYDLDEQLGTFGNTTVLYGLEKLDLVESRDAPAKVSTSPVMFKQWRLKPSGTL